MSNEHEHYFGLVLGPDGHGMTYGNYAGYVRRCKCGEYAPDFVAFGERRKAEELERARALVAAADQ